jgi:hypothetical protein
MFVDRRDIMFDAICMVFFLTAFRKRYLLLMQSPCS